MTEERKTNFKRGNVSGPELVKLGAMLLATITMAVETRGATYNDEVEQPVIIEEINPYSFQPVIEEPTTHIAIKTTTEYVSEMTTRVADPVIAEITSEETTSKQELTTVSKQEIVTSGQAVYVSDSSSELEMMAHLLMGEAGNQNDACQRAVGSVALNRVARTDFPNTLRGVIYQKNQYACINDGNFDKTPTEQCYKNAKWLLNGNNYFPTTDVIFQNNNYHANWVFYEQVGSEYFYTAQ